MNRGRHKKSKKSNTSKDAAICRITSIASELLHYYKEAYNNNQIIDYEKTYMSIKYVYKSSDRYIPFYQRYITDSYCMRAIVDRFVSFMDELTKPVTIIVRYGYKKESFQINI